VLACQWPCWQGSARNIASKEQRCPRKNANAP
jgi:hypothetical protein